MVFSKSKHCPKCLCSSKLITFWFTCAMCADLEKPKSKTDVSIAQHQPVGDRRLVINLRHFFTLLFFFLLKSLIACAQPWVMSPRLKLLSHSFDRFLSKKFLVWQHCKKPCIILLQFLAFSFFCLLHKIQYF